MDVVLGGNAHHSKPAGQDPEDPIRLRLWLSKALGYLLILPQGHASNIRN